MPRGTICCLGAANTRACRAQRGTQSPARHNTPSPTQVKGSDKVVASSPEGEPAVFDLSEGAPLGLKGLEVALKTMKKGEKAVIKLKPECERRPGAAAAIAGRKVTAAAQCRLCASRPAGRPLLPDAPCATPMSPQTATATPAPRACPRAVSLRWT